MKHDKRKSAKIGLGVIVSSPLIKDCAQFQERNSKVRKRQNSLI